MQPVRFHKHHGQNIRISDDGMTATRTCSFAHGICFGDRPLNHGEIFLVEILHNERGWSGHLRIGLTQHDPNTGFELPQYALPDFVTMLGKSWVMAVTKTQKYIFRDEEFPDLDQEQGTLPRKSILGQGEWIRTRCGTIRRAQLLPQNLPSNITAKLDGLALADELQDVADIANQESGDEAVPAPPATILPTEVGSRLGMVFTRSGKKGDLYVIVNGEEYGPMAKDIPICDAPLWPVIDVYGATKQVKIVHLTISESLQTLCRDKILQFIDEPKDLDSLPLPNKLKCFLKYET